jgi:hypothetical protein
MIPNHIILLGTEEVRAAASTMLHAAEAMNHAAREMEASLERHRVFLDDWLERYRATQPTGEVS